MYQRGIKRLFDILLSTIALIMLLPIFLVIVILLYTYNKGAGVFFTQERPGYKGRVFKVIKFKSMTEEKDNKGNLLPNEKRITPIGEFIRKTSLDELPQLINVLKGDMSLIGPRPLRVHYLPLYSEEQMRRHDVLPGITGWAQINGRNNLSWTDKFKLDVWYVDNISFVLDMKILFQTVLKVLRRDDINSDEDVVGVEDFNGQN